MTAQESAAENFQRGKGALEADVDSQKVSLMIEYGQDALTKGEMAEARSYFDRAVLLGDSLDFDYARQFALYGKGDFYLVQQKFDSAQTVLEEAIRLQPGIALQTKIKNLLATAHRYRGENQKAIEIYKEALALVDTVADARTAAGIAQNMGDAYMNLGARGQAFSNYNKAIAFGEKAQDSLFLATSLNNIGESHNSSKEYGDASYYLERALEISHDIGFKPGLLRVYLNLGNTRSGQSRFDEAETLYTRALELSSVIRPDTPPVQIQYNLGELYNRMERYEQAEDYFRRSLDNSRKLGIPQGIYFNSTGLGNIEIGRGDFSEAVVYYNDALEVAQQLNNPTFLKAAHDKLYELRKELGEYALALNHLEQATAISDSLTTREKEQMLADYQTRLQVQRKDQMNKTLQAEKASQEAQLQLQKWFLILGGLVIIISFISGLLLFRSNQEKNSINEKLKEQKNELEEANSIKNKLFSIVAHDLRTPLSALTGMLELVREEALTEEEMRELFREMEFSLHQNMSIMENLLVWAKQQMSGLKVDIQPLNARKIVDDIFGALIFNADHKNIQLENEIEEGFIVKGDYDLFKLVIRNLVSNSIKFSRNGDKITVNAFRKDGKALFEVRDTGIGIPVEIQSKIFADGIDSRKGTNEEKGSGLGLSLCREFIERQGGSIDFKSSEGEGTVFYFTLPMAESENRMSSAIGKKTKIHSA
ncbi:sensor histidine kinase [Balneolaceae bacterium YR4-1]|uniref:histidine kinase n=1 Tax=Halalkalibaculum roseum TaxID=2709311 RepID=A0A6M1SQP5_9BACT|nr:tetratricopeptide repeat protein [Halalkalibaculum roseum]NGP77419.1 sensor histidine kinase [Halalkalibaculum roseum]